MIPTDVHHLIILFSKEFSKDLNYSLIYLFITSRLDLEDRCHG